MEDQPPAQHSPAERQHEAAARRAAPAAAATRENRINMVWEYTQAFLAIALTAATIAAALGFFGPVIVASGVAGAPVSLAVPETLKNALFVVLGFYFGRTNHSRPVPPDPEA